MNYPLLTHIAEIDAPILFIAGENAHSLYFSQDAYKNASQPKELMILKDTVHVDLYDDVKKIPFDKLNEFFKKGLAVG